MFRGTQGRWNTQVVEAQRARESFSRRRWNRSRGPLDSGWYAVVEEWQIPRILQTEAQSADLNCAPLSEVMISGTPLREIQLWKSASAHSEEFVDARRMASGHLVVWLIMVKRWVKPIETVSGRTSSKWMWGSRVRLLCLGSFSGKNAKGTPKPSWSYWSTPPTREFDSSTMNMLL